jgi:pSer/pThr/pTyr-binding forkhead associated (FHA) protein
MSEHKDGKAFCLIVPARAGPQRKIDLGADRAIKEGGKQLPISTLTIGSAKDNDVRLEESSVARYHAQLTFDQTLRTWKITDLGSANGTQLIATDGRERKLPDPVPVNQFLPLKETRRSYIMIGSVQITVTHEPEQISTPTPAEAPLAGQSSGAQAPSESPASGLRLNVKHPSGWQQNVRLTGTIFSIGSDPNTNQLTLNRLNVAPRHALLIYEGRAGYAAPDGVGWYLLDLRTFGGTYVKGQRLDSAKRRLLQVGDVVTIDDVRITLEYQSDRWCLQPIESNTAQPIYLTDSPYTIGHSDDNDYHDDPGDSLAPYHAQIIQAPDGEGWMILDLGSASGTLLDSVPVPSFTPRPLKDGSRLDVGTISFYVILKRQGAAPAREQPSAVVGLTAATPGTVIPLTLELASGALAVMVGQSVSTTLTVANNSGVEDVVHLAVEPGDKLPELADWITFAERRVQLPPGTAKQVQVSIHPPLRSIGISDAKAADTFRVIGTAERAGPAVVEAVLELRKPRDLQLAADRLTVEAGQSIATVVSVTNTSAIRDRASLSIDGLPVGWGTFAPSTILLEPGQTNPVVLTIQVPREPEGRAGAYNFAIVANWKDSRSIPCDAALTVTSSDGLSDLKLLPETDKLKLSLSQDVLLVEAGQTVTTTVAVKNQSIIVDRIGLRVQGIPEGWATFTPDSVALLPGDWSEVALTIQPPREADSHAGAYYFAVIGTSEEFPDEEGAVAASLQLSTFSDFYTDVQPRQQADWRRAAYTLLITNNGNYGQAYELSARDEEQLLDFWFDPLQPVIAPGETRKVRVMVRSRRWIWYGVQKFHSLTLSVKPVDDQAPRQEQSARLIQEPVFSLGVVLVLGLLLLALLAPFVKMYWDQMTARPEIANVRPTVPPRVVAPTALPRIITVVQAPSPTAAPSPTVTPVVITQIATAPPVPTPPPPPSPVPQIVTIEVTSPPTATPSVESICTRRGWVEISGDGARPRAGILLYFNGRAITGTATSADGRYSMPVYLGEEWLQSIVVRDRTTRDVLQQIDCPLPTRVPVPTLTPGSAASS